MKKRILSLVLCAAMLLSMVVLMGAGTTGDTAADTTESAESAVSFLNAGPLVEQVQQSTGPMRARAATMNLTGSNATGSGVQLSKSVTASEDGQYTVRLEAYATGAQTTVVSTKPCDIVLVLDVSGSMEDKLGTSTTYVERQGKTNRDNYNVSNQLYVKLGNGEYVKVSISWSWDWGRNTYTYTYKDEYGNQHEELSTGSNTQFTKWTLYELRSVSKMDALKTAVNSFIDSVKAQSSATVTHNISIVKFAGKKNNNIGNDKYREDGYDYNYSQIVLGLTDVNNNAQTLKDTVNALTPDGATSADYGMQLANTALQSARTDSNKVVVMFTDGEPNHGNGFNNSVANDAIKASKTLKDAGATVYTIGCMTGADGTPVTNISSLTNINKYMHLVSSNYKYATSMNNPGDSTYPENNRSYYLSAASADDLSNIFQSISHQVGGSDTELTSSSVLKDAVTPYFEIPGGTNAQITLKTAACTGADSSGKLTFGTETAAPGDVRATVSDNIVSVTGFDYSANWCGSRTDADGNAVYGGQKLIVEFKIQPTNAFLGGNGVQTNVGEADGIYASDAEAPAEQFVPQNVDVAVKPVTPKATDTSIYLGETTNLEDRVTTDVSQLDGMNNKYVDVTYTITDKNGETVGTYIVPAGKAGSEGSWTWNSDSTVSPKQTTTYTVTCTVSPTQSGTYQSVSKETKFTITVNTCSLTISKTVTGDGADANQTFVFNVKDKNGSVVTTVVLKAGGRKTITGLPVGKYTVEEDTNWSWSFKTDNGNQTVTLGRANTETNVMPTATVSVTNTFDPHHWLTSIADAINKWTKTGIEQITIPSAK